VTQARADSPVRLQRYLSQCGVASRRAAERLIAEGRVAVNGTLACIGMTVDPANDSVTLDGAPLRPSQHVYILLNKPRGVVTTVKDTHGRRTVLDCIRGIEARVFPVGRLDFDVEGALLLTNDGDLAYTLTHPKFEAPKVYEATVRGRIEPSAMRRLSRGVVLEDGRTAPAAVEPVEIGPRQSVIRIVIHEGRKREVKRMAEAVGHPVLRLRRLSFAGLTAEGLKPGEWRELAPAEIARLEQLSAHTSDGSPSPAPHSNDIPI